MEETTSKKKDGKEINQLDEKEILRLQKELNRWENKYKKLQQVFRLQEEIIATYEAAYGEAPGLIEEEMQEKESKENNSFFKMMEKRSYNRFNQEQKAAITYDMQKHLRIIAGAGSGKTQTICAKAVYLMTQKQVDEERILMITFTRNAANELKKRVDNFSQRKTAVHIGTFHSIFFRIYNEICRKFPDVAMQGIQGDFSKDTAQKVNAVLQQLIRKYNLYLFDQYGEKTIASRLDYWQNMNLSIEEMIQLVKEKYDSIDKNTRQPISERLYGLLTELQEQKRRQQLLEFNDVLQNLKSALENDEIQRYIGQKYDYLFIDEFQDTNPLQWEIVKRMTKENGIKLIVVGDDDQSIYGFRGSEPAYIKNFEKEYPTKTLFLLTNYRSRAAIVQGANRLISYNKNDRIPKAMIPAQKEAGIMEAYLFSDTKAESQWLISQIQSFIQKNGKYKESIILYRSASQTQQLVQSLLKTNIPFVLEADSPYEGIFGIKFFQQFYQKIVHWQTAQNPQKKNQAYQQLLRQLMVDCYLKKNECDQYFSPKYQNIAITDYILSVRPNLKSKSAEIRQFEEALRKTDQHQEIYSLVQSYLHLPRIAKEIDQSDQEWIREEVKQHATFRSIQKLLQV